jgi:hypothetical protein
MTRQFALILFVTTILLAPAAARAQTPSKTYLLNVGKNQTFNDIASDDKTKPEPVTDVKELGGRALKVAFDKGDAVGVKSPAVKSWKPFETFRFDAVNPGKTDVKLILTILHARSRDFNTRVHFPITLKPGKNEVKIGLDEFTNVNGTAPALNEVTKFYFADEENKGPTIYFGDIWLESGKGGEQPGSGEPPASAGGGRAGPLVGYKIKGKVGGMDVDLTVTPFPLGPTSPPVAAVRGDPARLTRLRAAKMPPIDRPILFDTPEADAICSALEVFPPDNPWNLVVEDWPLHPNSKNIIESIGAAKPLRYNPDMGFVLVPPNQPKIEVKLGPYSQESDRGPYPAPNITPIEGWPVGYKGLTLEQAQRKNEGEADRHAIVVDPTNRMLYEFYQMRKTDAGWQASGAAIFDLKSNKMRPDGWTSSDAAGLPIYPAVVRHDELKRGAIEHALRVTVTKTRRAYVYPATHYASRLTDENLPRMGERIRLKKDVDIAGFSPEVQTILKALKKYGMFVADNGIDWAVSVAPDPRIPVLHEELRKLTGADFEVVEPPPGYKPAE